MPMVLTSTRYYIFDNTNSEEAEAASTKALEMEFHDVLSQLPMYEVPNHCLENVFKEISK